MYGYNLVLLLLQQMCVLVIAWLMSKNAIIHTPLMQVTVRLPHKFLCYIVFFHLLHHGHLVWVAHWRFCMPIPGAMGAVMGDLGGRLRPVGWLV